MKQRSTKASRPLVTTPRPAKPQNPQVNVQTRKVLSQHYRAKYGVK
jgi:hypothetical protein